MGHPPPDLRARLRAAADRLGPFGARLDVRAEVGSTSDEVAALADAGAPHGAVVVASAQRAGRGRHGNDWYSPSGTGLYLSVLLRRLPDPILTLMAGVAVAETLRRLTRLDAQLDWPNDVVVPDGGALRKVAGILAEGVAGAGGEASAHVVLGIGVNLREGGWPAGLADRVGSIEGLTGAAVDADELLVELLAALAGGCAALDGLQRADLLARWERLAPSSRGTPVTWTVGDRRHEGVTAGVDHDGALLVRRGGRLERLRGGEVRRVRPGG